MPLILLQFMPSLSSSDCSCAKCGSKCMRSDRASTLSRPSIDSTVSSFAAQYSRWSGRRWRTAPSVCPCCVRCDCCASSRWPSTGRRCAIWSYHCWTRCDPSFRCCSCCSCSFSSLHCSACNCLGDSSTLRKARRQRISTHFRLHCWRYFRF